MTARPILALFPLLAATAAFASGSTLKMGDDASIAKIVDEGKNRNQVMKQLRELTNNGPRLTGSPGLSRAQEWAMRKFNSYGLKNVRLEKWGEVPVGFERGRNQIGRMVEPYDREITFTTMNWTAGTNGLVRADAVTAPKTVAEVEAAPDKYRGKWLVMTGSASMRGAVDSSAAELKAAIDKLGIAGRIYGTRDDRVHSSGTWREKSFDKRPEGLNIIVNKESYDRIARNVDFGRKTTLEFNIDNRWIAGPIPQYNVVADLPGTEKPDEMVIVCGHLDSWNSPGSQGACDNGTGSSVAVEAARILTATGVKPKRTIRFVLWSGEEQGLLGSRGYVQTHKDELDKISAVLNDDGGSNYQGGYQGIETMKAMMEAAFAPTAAAFPELPMEFASSPTMPAGGSSDHAPFNWEGVPGFFTMEKGKADYGKVWHTQYDRYEFAVPEYLVQSSTNHAVVAFNLACADTLLPRGPKPAPRTTAMRLDNALAVGADRVYEDPAAYLQYWWEHVGQGGDVHGHDHQDDYVMFVVDYIKRWTKRVAVSVRK